MKKFLAILITIAFCFAPSIAQAFYVKYEVGADDYASLYINTSHVLTWDSGGSGGAHGYVDLAEGWYSISLDYKNRWGTAGLMFFWDEGLGGAISMLPAAYLRSKDASGQWVNGLKAEYSWLNSGEIFHTEYGEGPVFHHGTSIYENVVADWPGSGWDLYGVSGWGELLTGEIYVGATAPPPDPIPEPATMLLLGSGLVGLAGAKRKKLKK